MPETAEEISEKPEVRKELQRATGEKARQRVKARGRDKFWFVAYALILAGCVVLFFLFGAKVVPLPQPTVDILRRILRGAALITVILAIAKAASVYALGGIEDPSTRFTLQRVMHLVVALLIALIVVSVIFVNWYAGIAALGIGSIIIGLAVQTPLKSFIAWIYILVRQPYRVGDRIKIGEATGERCGNSVGNTSPAIIRAAVSSNFRMRKCSMRSYGITPGRCFLISGTKSNFRLPIRAI